jgi:hypothetical protein
MRCAYRAVIDAVRRSRLDGLCEHYVELAAHSIAEPATRWATALTPVDRPFLLERISQMVTA